MGKASMGTSQLQNLVRYVSLCCKIQLYCMVEFFIITNLGKKGRVKKKQ